MQWKQFAFHNQQQKDWEESNQQQKDWVKMDNGCMQWKANAGKVNEICLKHICNATISVVGWIVISGFIDLHS